MDAFCRWLGQEIPTLLEQPSSSPPPPPRTAFDAVDYLMDRLKTEAPSGNANMTRPELGGSNRRKATTPIAGAGTEKPLSYTPATCDPPHRLFAIADFLACIATPPGSYKMVAHPETLVNLGP